MARNHNEDKPSVTDTIKPKHHWDGDFVCEAEVIENGILTCCMHDPKATDFKKAWKFIPKVNN